MYINLIARQRAEQHKYKTIGDFLVRTFAVLLVLLLIFVTRMLLDSRRLASEATTTRAEVAKYAERAEQVRRLRARQAKLKPTVDLVHKAQVSVNRWRTLLAEIALALPPTVWVDAIQPKFDAGSETVQMEAFSEDAPGVQLALERLNRSPLVARADLTTADIPARDPLTGRLSNPITFTVKADLKGMSVAAQ